MARSVKSKRERKEATKERRSKEIARKKKRVAEMEEFKQIRGRGR